MNKERIINQILPITIIFLCLILIAGFFCLNNKTAQNEDISNLKKENSFLPTNDYASSTENVSSPIDNYASSTELHWGRMPIKFKINRINCNSIVIPRIRGAFSHISNATDRRVLFEEVPDYTTKDTNKIKVLIKSLPNKNLILKDNNGFVDTIKTNENGEASLNYSLEDAENTFTLIRAHNESEEPYMRIFYRYYTEGLDKILLDDTLSQEGYRAGYSYFRDNSTDILINCHSKNSITYGSSISKQYSLQSEPIIREQSGYQINYATIDFYNVGNSGGYYAACLSYPDVEITSILITLGITPSDNRSSIMHMTNSACAVTDIDKEIIAVLKDTYYS